MSRAIFLTKLIVFSALFVAIGTIQAKRICGPNQFRCKNGRTCVAALDVCDQESHCKDGSDENLQFCNGNFTNLLKSMADVCSPGMYRCRFGGCVDASKLCDGNSDCYDSSDETQDLCRKNRCVGKNFRCDYGACIPQRKMCNGKIDCPDGSDETRTICEEHLCSLGSFKCNYGACIPGDKVCDGKNNCLDKSDELKTACEVDHNGTDIYDKSVDF